MARKPEREKLAGWKLLFWLYLILLFVFVVVKFDGSLDALRERMAAFRRIRASEPDFNLNLEPLKSIRLQLDNLPQSWAVKNLVGNVAVFIPFGWLLPRSHRHLRHLLTVLLLALFVILAIEVFQYVTFLGSCDIDDVILNMAGVFAGYVLLFLPGHLRRKP